MEQITKQSQVVGAVFFGLIIFIVIGLWEVYFSGKVVSKEIGVVVEAHIYSAKGSGNTKAIVELNSGEIISILCNRCFSGGEIIVLKKQHILGNGYVYEEYVSK